MKRILLFLLMIGISAPAICGTKRALTVFIGNYPPESGWNRLSSENDKGIVLNMLDRLGFEKENIDCLLDEEATYDAILNAMDKLIAAAGPGDQIYVHFSCHGQQITDQDGDEALLNPKDRYDEAIVPYDAYVAYGWHGYTGDRHLRDDILNDKLALMQKAVGRRGCLLVVYDACHSGDLDRFADNSGIHPYRGTFDAFEQPYAGCDYIPRIKQVTWLSISACKDFQTNFEVEIDGQRYGRLSYAISRSLCRGMTYGALIAALREQYRILPMAPGKMQTLQNHAPDRMNTKRLFTDG